MASAGVLRSLPTRVQGAARGVPHRQSRPQRRDGLTPRRASLLGGPGPSTLGGLIPRRLRLAHAALGRLSHAKRSAARASSVVDRSAAGAAATAGPRSRSAMARCANAGGGPRCLGAYPPVLRARQGRYCIPAGLRPVGPGVVLDEPRTKASPCRLWQPAPRLAASRPRGWVRSPTSPPSFPCGPVTGMRLAPIRCRRARRSIFAPAARSQVFNNRNGIRHASPSRGAMAKIGEPTEPAWPDAPKPRGAPI